MLVLLLLLFLGSVCSHMRNHNISNVCDDFHLPVSVFNGKYGKLMMYLGMTREEFKAGDLTLTINNCGGEDGGVCIVKSAWKNAIFEGNRDNKYKIVLTEVGDRNINKPRSPMRCRGTSFPIQNYVRLRLIIDSDIADGIPKIPQVSLASFGGIHECTPKPISRIIRPICPRSTKCPSDLATIVQGNNLLLTLPAERKWSIEFTVAFEGNATINATVASEKAILQHKRRCGSLHSFRLRRTWQNVRDGNIKNVKVLMSIAESPIPMLTAFTSRSRRGPSCGITCGVFKGCVKPITPKPQLTTTSSLPTSTASPVTTTTTPIPPVKPNEPLLEEGTAKPQKAVKPKESEVSDKSKKGPINVTKGPTSVYGRKSGSVMGRLNVKKGPKEPRTPQQPGKPKEPEESDKLEKLETNEESKKGPIKMTKGHIVQEVNGTKGSRSGPGRRKGNGMGHPKVQKGAKESRKPQPPGKPKESAESDKLEKPEGTNEESKKVPRKITKGPRFGSGRRRPASRMINRVWFPRKTGNGMRRPGPTSRTGTRLGSRRSLFDELEDGASEDVSDKTKDGSAMVDQRRKLDELFSKLQNIMDFNL